MVREIAAKRCCYCLLDGNNFRVFRFPENHELVLHDRFCRVFVAVFSRSRIVVFIENSSYFYDWRWRSVGTESSGPTASILRCNARRKAGRSVRLSCFRDLIRPECTHAAQWTFLKTALQSAEENTSGFVCLLAIEMQRWLRRRRCFVAMSYYLRPQLPILVTFRANYASLSQTDARWRWVKMQQGKQTKVTQRTAVDIQTSSNCNVVYLRCLTLIQCDFQSKASFSVYVG